MQSQVSQPPSPRLRWGLTSSGLLLVCGAAWLGCVACPGSRPPWPETSADTVSGIVDDPAQFGPPWTAEWTPRIAICLGGYALLVAFTMGRSDSARRLVRVALAGLVVLLVMFVLELCRSVGLLGEAGWAGPRLVDFHEWALAVSRLANLVALVWGGLLLVVCFRSRTQGMGVAWDVLLFGASVTVASIAFQEVIHLRDAALLFPGEEIRFSDLGRVLLLLHPAVWASMAGCGGILLVSHRLRRVLEPPQEAADGEPSALGGTDRPETETRDVSPDLRRSVSLGRTLTRHGGLLLVACCVLPAVRGCSQDVVPIVEYGRLDSLSMVLLLPYVMGGMVAAAVFARARSAPAAIQRVAMWMGAGWFLLVAGIAGFGAISEVKQITPEHLMGLSSPEDYFDVACEIFVLTCPLIIIAFLVWCRRWAHDLPERIKVGQLLAAFLCFDWFAAWPLSTFVDNQDFHGIRYGLWLSLLACTVIAGGTLLEFPRGKRDREEVEREFGPPEGEERPP